MERSEEMFEEIGCDEIEDTEIPASLMSEVFNDPAMDEYIREYQEQNALYFENLVNLS